MLSHSDIAKLQKIISEYIDPEEYSLFVFSSRAQKNNNKFSDIDIGIEGKTKIPFGTLAHLQDAFENSDFPYTVDVVDF